MSIMTQQVQSAVDALAPFRPSSAEDARNMLRFWVRRDEFTDAQLDLAAYLASEARDPQSLDCPDWCTIDHSTDDERDDLVLHMADDHADGTLRRLLDAGEGSTLKIAVARTDCPTEGRVGVPTLTVQADVELTTWEQAAELSRSILDGFGYLKGA